MRTSFESFLIDKLGKELDELKREYQAEVNEKNAEYEIRAAVEEHISELFNDVAENLDVRSGDLSPAEQGDLGAIEDSLVEAVLNWYKNNT